MNRAHLVPFWLPLLLLVGNRAPAALASGATTQPQVGHFQVKFTDRSPHSEIGTQHRRHHTC